MCEKMTESKIEKIKASNAEIIVRGTKEKPYYEIKYFDLSDNEWKIGYGSYKLDFVFAWKEVCFEIVDDESKQKVMSNDLISRKALMVAINTDFYEHFTAHHDSDQTALIDMVMQDIEEIPTAYDVDAVYDFWNDKKWREAHDVHGEIENVIAWRPLPNPYNPPEESKQNSEKYPEWRSKFLNKFMEVK